MKTSFLSRTEYGTGMTEKCFLGLFVRSSKKTEKKGKDYHLISADAHVSPPPNASNNI